MTLKFVCEPTGVSVLVNPTAENIAIVIYNLLRPRLDAKLELQIRLYETERNFVEYPVN